MHCCSGAAAVEMALVTPLMLILMFGSFELGNYFLDNHVVAKAVRDGARYAARRGFGEYSCAAASADVIDKTRNLTRTGQVWNGGVARLPGWNDPATITISVSCNTTGNSGGGFAGVYEAMSGGAPVVTVTAAVPYSSLFNSVGFSSSNLILRGRAQSPVLGI